MKKLIREIIFKFDLLFNFYYRYLDRPKKEISIYLNNLSEKKRRKIFFIQIGANDGQWGDNIYKFVRRDNWSGILIEPQREIFKRLLNNYKKRKNLFFENIAIDSTSGERDLYKISFCNSQWASGISSFIKNDVQKLIDAGYIERMAFEESIKLPSDKREWIGVEKVKIETLSNIIAKYKVKNIDLIMIDAEGYDFEIIKTIPFEEIKPSVIVYEHSHFNEEVMYESWKYLNKHGYRTIPTNGNTIAELI